jgi:hypothetical protein
VKVAALADEAFPTMVDVMAISITGDKIALIMESEKFIVFKCVSCKNE